MPYKIEYGPWDRRTSANGITSEMVIGLYEKARAAGEADIKIFNDAGNEIDPHQFALDLRSAKWGDNA